MYFLKKNDLHKLFYIWDTKMNLYAPTYSSNEVSLLPYNKKLYTEKYINFAVPVKEYIFNPKENLFNWKKKQNGSIKIINYNKKNNNKKKIFFGVRSCDTYGIKYMDHFYMSEYEDTIYKLNRQNTYIVQVNCLKADDFCYCSSLNLGGPFSTKGGDIEVTDVKNGYLFESHNKKGDELINISLKYLKKIKNKQKWIEEKNFLLKNAKKTFKINISLENINNVLDRAYSSEIWNEFSKGCIGCTGCTNVCPTCTCFNIVEENINKNNGNRVRYWDSCQSSSFTLNAGNHNPRNLTSRVRFRIYDKIKYIKERFGYEGCTGCGRCIYVCPSNINIINIIKKLINKFRNNNNKLIKSKENKLTYELSNKKHNNFSNEAYIPNIATIIDIIKENENIKRFKIKYDDDKLNIINEFKGQFFELTIFGFGEIAISIPYCEKEKNNIEFAIKKVGKVTSEFHKLKVGDKIGVRGPFGKEFPYYKAYNKNIFIVGSGVGIAPIRSVISQIINNKKNYGEINIIVSGKNYNSIIYKKDFEKWSKIKQVNVYYALSEKSSIKNSYLGTINDILLKLKCNWKNTVAFACASPRRIKLVAKDLLKLGILQENIFMALETHMRCGIGKCGHCKVGSYYICSDGPILNYSQMIKLPSEY